MTRRRRIRGEAAKNWRQRIKNKRKNESVGGERKEESRLEDEREKVSEREREIIRGEAAKK